MTALAGPTTARSAHPGLGTSIVEALARQLDATAEISSGPAGMTVSIIHVA